MAPPCSVTTTEETGRHVTPERIRRGAEAMERDGFGLAFECPLLALDGERILQRLRVMYCVDSPDEYSRSTNGISGQLGRFA